MARRLFLFLLVAVASAWAADDAWSKVKALKTGTELRVYKKGSMQPILAQMDELTDNNLVVIVKKTQTAIARDEIDRIDARPQAGRRVTTETTTKETVPDAKSASEQPSPGRGPDVPGTSTSTNVSLGSKPDFELVYRRAQGAPKK
ncbi:MAG: hypothetical protein ABSB88_01245 [Bryobacteraceae bacterium]|jgi:hypothetical protein